MSKLYILFSGIIIGLGVILPGVSGSVIAIMLGIYDSVIYLLNDNEKSLIYKIKELIPIVFGIMIGVIIFGNIFIYFIEKYEVQIKYLFMGLILGSIPILKNQIENDNNSTVKYKYLIITFVLSLLLFILPSLDLIKYSNTYNSFTKMFVGGFLYISGKIIPGISSSFFLMILGMYDYILNIMSNPFSLTIYELIKLIPFFIGVIVGLMSLLKLINYLLLNHLSETYSIIIGFVLGSIIAIYPGFKLEISYILSVLIMIFSYYFTYKLAQKSKI